MSASIAIEATPPRRAELRRLLDGNLAFVWHEAGGEAPDCVLVVHEPPDADALAQLASSTPDARALPRPGHSGRRAEELALRGPLADRPHLELADVAHAVGVRRRGDHEIVAIRVEAAARSGPQP
ncbi:MAG TPA: hypothetical protein VLS89_04280, partial [Candidatus Nanopelagicales bacterium]|nr:hypothetical protein [Candidatus Nanopelagicales bacterium]